MTAHVAAPDRAVVHEFTELLLTLLRSFGLFERNAICCGTVTVPQCMVLQRLLDGRRDVSSLATDGGVTNSAMTRLLDGLERRALIRRVRDAVDRRRVEIELTAAGQKEAGRLRDATHAAVARVVGELPETDRQAVLASLAKLGAALERASGDGSACCVPTCGTD